MDLKKIAFSEQFSHALSSKRKVVSGFGLGAGASLLVITVIFLYCPFKFNPMFQGFGGLSSNSSLSSWSFSFTPLSSSSSTTTSSSELKRDTNLDGSKNGSFTGFNGGEVVKSKTHEGNFTDRSQNASFFSYNGSGEKTLEGNSKNGTLSSEEVNNEKTHPGILSGEVRNGSISSKEEVSANNVKKNEGGLNGTASDDGKSSRSPSTEEKKIQETHGGNSSEIVQGTNGGNFSEKIQETHGGNSSQIDKNAYSGMPKGLDYRSEKCDIYKGRWVRNEGKPLYPGGSCPLIDRDFDCLLNGRPDTDFLKWRWQPDECDLPSLNATDFLERLRGKRLIYVGDSLNRNMWESLVCILRHSVKNKSSVHEISGRSHFKERVQGFYSFRYDEYNCSVDFVSAPFLVSESSVKGVNGSMPTLRLDLMDHTIAAYRGADVVVFNTGHWWTHEKTSKGENYYQERNHIYPKLNVLEAYNKALMTWAKWVDMHIDTNRTLVFFRGYSVTHFRGGQWNSGGQCHKETEPIFNQTFLAKYPSKMKAVEKVIHKMKTPVVYMNISRLTDFRKDGHPSIYRMEYKTEEARTAAVGSQDCSHWCLPGVPDTWNELLYASLLKVGRGSWKT